MDGRRKHTFSEWLVLVIATGGYLGYTPVAPGTVGSLIGLLLLWPLDGTAHLLITLLLAGGGILVAGRAAALLEGHDPHVIIIDEIAGIAVATLLLPPHLLHRLVAFFLFRLFDILKPFPSRQIERLPGGIGIVGDDLTAGLYSNLLVQVWRLF